MLIPKVSLWRPLTHKLNLFTVKEFSCLNECLSNESRSVIHFSLTPFFFSLSEQGSQGCRSPRAGPGADAIKLSYLYLQLMLWTYKAMKNPFPVVFRIVIYVWNLFEWSAYSTTSMALLANIRQGQKGSLSTKFLAYLCGASVTKIRKFYNVVNRCQFHKHYICVTYGYSKISRCIFENTAW